MHPVTVYSKPSCVQCTATKRDLDTRGIAYNQVDLTQDDAALARIQELGFLKVPVVISGETSWVGYRPDKISELAALINDRLAAN